MIIQTFYKIIIISKKIDKSLKFSRSNNCNININNNFQNGINKQTFKSFHASIHFLLPISSKLYLQYLRSELSHLKFRNIGEILSFNYFYRNFVSNIFKIWDDDQTGKFNFLVKNFPTIIVWSAIDNQTIRNRE